MHESDNRATVSTADVEQNIGDEPMAKKESSGFNSLVNITVKSYRHSKHDTDGICFKSCLDGIVREGILADDSTSEVKKISYESFIIKKSEKEKTIIEIGPA